GFQNDLGARTQGGMEKCEQTRPQTTGCPCTGNVGDGQTQIALNDLGIMSQGGIQLCDHGWRGPLLWTIYSRCSARPTHRIGDVTGYINTALPNTWVHACYLDVGKGSQG